MRYNTCMRVRFGRSEERVRQINAHAARRQLRPADRNRLEAVKKKHAAAGIDIEAEVQADLANRPDKDPLLYRRRPDPDPGKYPSEVRYKAFEGTHPGQKSRRMTDEEVRKFEEENPLYPPGKDYIQCVGKISSRKRRCKRVAILGTDFCCRHGGKSGRHGMKHAQGSKFSLNRIMDRAENYSADTDIKSLKKEIGLLRSVLDQILVIMDGKELRQGDLDNLLKTVNEIRKTVGTLSRIEDGLQMTINVHQVSMIMTQVVGIIKQEVSDGSSRARIADRISGLVAPGYSGGLESKSNKPSGVGREL